MATLVFDAKIPLYLVTFSFGETRSDISARPLNRDVLSLILLTIGYALNLNQFITFLKNKEFSCELGGAKAQEASS